MGADWIELDARRTSDGRIVCIHDGDLKRTTGEEGSVANMTYDEISSLDARQGQRIPLITDVLDFARGKLGVDIELKVRDLEEELVRLVRRRRMEKKILFSSFLRETLGEVRSLGDDLLTGVLIDKQTDDPFAYARDVRANSIKPVFLFVESTLVENAHAVGLRVIPWTVDNVDIMEELVIMGVDGIITNTPDVCARVVKSHGKSAKTGSSVPRFR
jgi:glycerophosphoryl diester phosphodiesterase